MRWIGGEDIDADNDGAVDDDAGVFVVERRGSATTGGLPEMRSATQKRDRVSACD